MLCPFPSVTLDAGAPFDPYRLEHKAIRVMLGRLLETAGRTDFGDAVSFAALRRALESAVEVLQRHARTEVLFVDAVLAAHAPAEAAGVQDDHIALDGDLTELVVGMDALANLRDGAAARARGHALYLQLTRFVATYLGHMAYEEEEVLPLLHRHVGEIALRRALLAAHQHLPFEQRAITYVHVLAAVSPHERAALRASGGEAPAQDGPEVDRAQADPVRRVSS